MMPFKYLFTINRVGKRPFGGLDSSLSNDDAIAHESDGVWLFRSGDINVVFVHDVGLDTLIVQLETQGLMFGYHPQLAVTVDQGHSIICITKPIGAMQGRVNITL